LNLEFFYQSSLKIGLLETCHFEPPLSTAPP
jgi:hypothetical protein